MRLLDIFLSGSHIDMAIMDTRRFLQVLVVCGTLGACGGGGSSASFNLMVEPPGGSGLANSQVSVIGFGPIITRDITLPASVMLTGNVTDGAGSPLAGVEVTFQESATKPEIASATTNGSGDYSVVIPAGTWVAILGSGVANLGNLTSTGVVVAGTPASQDFQFASPVAVSGSVFELGGPGIASAEVKFTGLQTGATATLIGDGVGFYTTTLVPDVYEVEVTPAGAAATTHLKQMFPSETISFAGTRNFSLQPGVQISGTVMDNNGMPLLENTDVKVVLSAGSNFFPPLEVITNQVDGTYTIGPVPPGAIAFELEAPDDSGFPRQRIISQVVGPTAQILDIPLLVGFVLSGTILRDDGVTAEENVEIQPRALNGAVAPDEGDTDAAGFFELSLFPGTYTIDITPETTNLQLPQSLTFNVAGPATLDLTLTVGAMVAGTVTNLGSPAPDVRVEIPGVIGASDVTDGSGGYAFLAPLGSTGVDLNAEDGALEGMVFDSLSGVIISGPGPTLLDIALSPATSGTTIVVGTVFESDGTTPVVGAELVARHNTTGDVIGRTVSGVGGVFILVVL